MSVSAAFAMVRAVSLFLISCLIPGGAGTGVEEPTSRDPKTAPSGIYSLDPTHSQIVFSVMHLGLSPYYGRFGTLAGSLQFDGAEPAKSAVRIEVDMNSLDTPNDNLDQELKSGTTFDVTNFARASFVSNSVKPIDELTGTVTGDLTIKGVTRSVKLDVRFHGTRSHPFRKLHLLGFSASGKISRKEFGLDKTDYDVFVGDVVELLVQAEFAKKSD